MSAESATVVLWVVWYVSWIMAAAWQDRTKVRMVTDMAGIHRALFSVGLVLLLFVPTGSAFSLPRWGSLTQRLWAEPGWLQWSLFALVVASFAFCWWARLHLGRLWSGFVTLKEGHRIVDTGPYGLVRHPIYSGIMMAALATAALKATPVAVAGFAFTILGLSMTARIEEKFLRAQLGADAYDDYRRRVGMLVPRLP
ncbi:MAG: isoprenylcysteine carboxylmethyltransferase family protein [Rhizomicrobium sp.]|jgi:protein-S-isoprenylcysteine O-methyltransferase Ste14